MDYPKKDMPTPDDKDQKNQGNKKPVTKQAHDGEKFSPGEPDDYDADEFATD
jgi:hypothetical protein